MTGCVLGRDDTELRERVARVIERMGHKSDPAAFVREHGDTWILGTVEQVQSGSTSTRAPASSA